MTAMEGQMVFTALGRNIVSERRITFSNIQLNVDDFNARLDQVYNSERDVLQETPSGYRRLDKVVDDSGDVTLRATGFSNTGVSPITICGFTSCNAQWPIISRIGR